MSPTKDRAALLALLNQLEEAVDAFNADWPGLVRHIELYKLPVLSAQEAPARILPEYQVGEPAIQLAARAFRTFSREPHQHPATVVRYPGVLVLGDASLGVEIEQINALKSRIRAIVTSYPPGSRAALTRKTFPGRMMLQIYRRIHAASDVRRVLWTWAGHTTSNRRITAEEAAQEIEAARRRPPMHLDRETWNEVIDAELRQLAGIPPSSELVYRRRIAPHPRVIVYPHGSEDKPVTYHGNLPLVVFAPQSDPLPEISPLRPFLADVRIALRRDRRRLQPLIERAHLYAPETEPKKP